MSRTRSTRRIWNQARSKLATHPISSDLKISKKQCFDIFIVSKYLVQVPPKTMGWQQCCRIWRFQAIWATFPTIWQQISCLHTISYNHLDTINIEKEVPDRPLGPHPDPLCHYIARQHLANPQGMLGAVHKLCEGGGLYFCYKMA